MNSFFTIVPTKWTTCSGAANNCNNDNDNDNYDNDNDNDKDNEPQLTSLSWTRNFQENPEDVTVPRWGDMDMVGHWNNLGFIVPKTIKLKGTQSFPNLTMDQNGVVIPDTILGNPITVLQEVERRPNWLPAVEQQTAPLTSLLQQALKLEVLNLAFTTFPFLPNVWKIFSCC